MRVRRWAAAAGAALLWAVVLALPALVPGGGAGPAARASQTPAPTAAPAHGAGPGGRPALPRGVGVLSRMAER